MAGPLVLLLLCFLHCTAAAEDESVQFLVLSSTDPTQIPVAVTLPTHDLKSVASSVVDAEAWLRVNVLSHYPASKITHIEVGHNLLCSSPENRDNFHFLLPSLKNLHYSLTRWGLHKEIKLSPSASPHCIKDSQLKLLVEFVQTTNSTYFVTPLNPFPEESIKKFGSFDIKVVVRNKPTSRKLLSLTPRTTMAARSPLPPLMGSPFYFPPLIGTNSPPPAESPVYYPPYGGVHLPPCNPVHAPAPAAGVTEEKLWCVAKPSVPVDTLQEAIDFACGEGGADCEEIQPDGSCYSPDTVVAHASYAFNSYWQKTKNNGGSCGFGGTAMIINADPSFMNCRFVVT